ncbi:nuclear ribonuclease P subunit Rpp20 (Rpp2/Pop7) [Andalucia godoyi]|uniref:Nuclear ribonuclease P subunit Rpp20 (Rpp2/Pop7) n=1 Tax=Andalucia godoyi TaxID=505711 RepID=A0A8K0AHG4_ANDGO|nr:nuclear ribonuclease P subunit Rpp20 (Rpp2/Pop7) [Andalucia godoyi]|eukprot:ANDGO_03617.mRNA.1 nuclear ribonuclease P subunit Rpp20 (Rpp2/Pop7)
MDAVHVVKKRKSSTGEPAPTHAETLPELDGVHSRKEYGGDRADGDDWLLSATFPDATILRPSPDPKLYRHVKRPPFRMPAQPNDVFVSSDSSKIAVLKRIKALLTHDLAKHHTRPVLESQARALAKVPFVCVHGLGRAVQIAVEISLRAQRELGGAQLVTVSATTHSVPLIDDFEPLVPGLEPLTQVRYNSAIIVRLSMKTLQSFTT